MAITSPDEPDQPDDPGEIEASPGASDCFESLSSVLAHQPAGLFLDIDGTLAPLHTDPAAVSITPALRDSIAALAERMTVVILSGRATADSRRIIGLDGLTYVGNHGGQWLREGVESVLPAAQPYVARIHQIAENALVHFAEYTGIYVEDKGPTMAIHYRNVEDSDDAIAAIDDFLDSQPAIVGLRRTDGKMVKEVKPPLNINKGTAIAATVAEASLRSVVMFGDDTTDVDAFRAISTMRAAGAIDGLSIGVLSAGTPAAVLESVDCTVAGTDEVEQLLARLAG